MSDSGGKNGAKTQSAFFEGHDGIPWPQYQTDEILLQIVLPMSLRPRVLRRIQLCPLDGHHGKTLIHLRLRRVKYCPQMSADEKKNCTGVPTKAVKITESGSSRRRTRSNYLHQSPSESVVAYIVGPLPKSQPGFRFIVAIFDRFRKLTQAVPLRLISCLGCRRVIHQTLRFKICFTKDTPDGYRTSIIRPVLSICLPDPGRKNACSILITIHSVPDRWNFTTDPSSRWSIAT